MTDFVLIVSIVSHGKQELVTDSAVKAGSFGGTTLKGRGISSNSIVAALGIDSVKDVVYIVCQRSQEVKIREAIIRGLSNEKKHTGCIFTVGADSLHRKEDLAVEKGGLNMSQNLTHDVINVIVNRGFADDVMDAARKAGAGGGTVINARGTAREDDERFFGMHIVPEKEMLIIVVEHANKDKVMSAIQNLECLSEPGSGIVYTLPAESFEPLGRK